MGYDATSEVATKVYAKVSSGEKEERVHGSNDKLTIIDFLGVKYPRYKAKTSVS